MRRPPEPFLFQRELGDAGYPPALSHLNFMLRMGSDPGSEQRELGRVSTVIFMERLQAEDFDPSRLRIGQLSLGAREEVLQIFEINGTPRDIAEIVV